MLPLFITLTTHAGIDADLNVNKIIAIGDDGKGGSAIDFDDGKTWYYKEPITMVRALINQQTHELLDQLAVTIRGH